MEKSSQITYKLFLAFHVLSLDMAGTEVTDNDIITFKVLRFLVFHFLFLAGPSASKRRVVGSLCLHPLLFII